MRCWSLRVGGWVGGWENAPSLPVSLLTCISFWTFSSFSLFSRSVMAVATRPQKRKVTKEKMTWVGGWVGGWVSGGREERVLLTKESKAPTSSRGSKVGAMLW